MNYPKVNHSLIYQCLFQWETGGASGGANGLGGSSAGVGYSNGLSGASNRSFELAGSAVNGAFLDGGPAATSLIANSLNSDGVLGRYTFDARNGGVVVTPPSTAVPEPFTIVGTLIGATVAFRTRQRLKATNKL